jgi:transposase
MLLSLGGYCYAIVKATLQHIATAAAINLDRIVAWLEDISRALTRTTRFAALTPV